MKRLTKKSKENCIKRINKFLQLEKNWNGYTANKINHKSCTNAIELLNSLKYTPQVFPLPDGNVQIEFEDDNIYLEIEIQKHYYRFFCEGKSITEPIMKSYHHTSLIIPAYINGLIDYFNSKQI